MLHVHRSERADTLADALGELLADPLPDPLATEVVAVPARGVERWLTQRLAHRLGARPGRGDGVCAGVDFPSPAALVADAVATVTGADPTGTVPIADPIADPWHPERAAWALLEILDSSADGATAPWRDALAGGIAAAGRYAVARHLAVLFADYASHRPALLASWRDGGGVPGGPDGPAADLAWQPPLWRRLAARIDGPDPAARLAAVAQRLHTEPTLVALPPRLSLFGPTRLPADQLAVLTALAVHREVHLWLAHPSPALWARVAAAGLGPSTSDPAVPIRRADPAVPMRRADPAVPMRRADPAAALPRHPLLASLGRDTRELQLRLAAAAPAAIDHHHPAPAAPPTLLGRLQDGLRTDRPPAPASTGSTGPAAGVPPTVQVHACHGPARQVEVLREVVLGLLAADPGLEPRDVLVMCPDVETFAPLISATFGLGPRTDPGPAGGIDGRAGPGHPGQRLAVRLADRALRQTNPLLDVVARLLELAPGRASASQLLDLLAADPVRRRFGFDDADLDRLRELVSAAGVRWGLDAAHRTPFHLDGFPQNTWAAGLDRLLLGVAMPEPGLSGSVTATPTGRDDLAPGWLGTALPLGDVGPGDVDLLGRLAEFVDRVAAAGAALQGPQPLTAWTAALTDALDALTVAERGQDWQVGQARTELAAAAATAGPLADGVALGLADVQGLLAERLAGRPGRAGFRTGALTVATLVPMRSVPHRVVCLLGLDDGAFPRAGIPDGDDVLARDPLVGERDPRSEDRQLLLDAIGAATEHLVVVHSGADERTGARRPPAVPLGELLDTLAALLGSDGSAPVVTRHPLQPFDARNFVPGALVPDRVFSFDEVELAGARAGAGTRAAPSALVTAPLPPVHDPVIVLDDLVSFVEHPVRAFLRQRVGVSLWSDDGGPADTLPVELDGLARWRIGDRLLRDRLAGHDLDHCRQAEWRRGELPPGALGDAVLTEVLGDVEPLVDAARAARSGTGAGPDRESGTDLDIEVALPDGTRVVGTLGGLFPRPDDAGGMLLRVEYSRLAAKHRVRAWVRLLALVATTATPWQAVTLGRGRGAGVLRADLGGPARPGRRGGGGGPLDAPRAMDLLADLVALHRRGLCAPLPLPTGTALAYAEALRGSGETEQAVAAACAVWSGRLGAERDDDAHLRVWGRGADPAVLDLRPGGGFGALAQRVWDPLLDAEEVRRT